jgi:hypothetical protein
LLWWLWFALVALVAIGGSLANVRRRVVHVQYLGYGTYSVQLDGWGNRGERKGTGAPVGPPGPVVFALGGGL